MTKKNTDKVILPRNSPERIAKIFRETKRPTLRHQQGDWLDYNGRAYDVLEDATIDAEVQEWLADAYSRRTIKDKDEDGKVIGQRTIDAKFDPTPADTNNVVTSLKRLCHVKAATHSPPCWLDGSGPCKPRNIISLRNGLLDVETRTLHEHTPNFFTRTTLALDYDANALDPWLWYQFLDQVLGDQEQIDCLQEAFGYLISSDTSHQKVFMFYGPPRGGKGTTLRIKTLLTGRENNANPTVKELGSAFPAEALIGKSNLNITDLNCDNRQALADACSILNAISGEDDIQVQRKNKISWNGRLAGRFTVVTNTLPNFGTGAVALATRLIVFIFKNSFVGREDITLTEKLAAELPHILDWALAGLARLRARGHFLEPAASKLAKIKILHQADPLRGFVDERCVLDMDSEVDKDLFYKQYRLFWKDAGSYPLAKNKLLQRLTEVYPSVAVRRPRTETGARNQVVAGLRFDDELTEKLWIIDANLVAQGVPIWQARGAERVALEWQVTRHFDDTEELV